MHELSIASAILDAVKAEAAKHPNSRPTGVGVRIGEWAGVDPDSLSFGFEVLVKGTDLELLKLHIEYIPRRQRCEACGEVFAAGEFTSDCPACHGTRTTLAGGDELNLAYVELEEAVPEVAPREFSPDPVT